MTTLIKIERYSNTGFIPRKQTHLLNNIMKYTMPFSVIEKKYKKELHKFPEFETEILTSYYMEKREYNWYSEHILENFEDFKEGIWIFEYGKKSNLLLNHLKRKVKRNIGYLPEDAIVYSNDMKKKGSLGEMKKNNLEFYVPKRSLVNLVKGE